MEWQTSYAELQTSNFNEQASRSDGRGVSGSAACGVGGAGRGSRDVWCVSRLGQPDYARSDLTWLDLKSCVFGLPVLCLPRLMGARSHEAARDPALAPSAFNPRRGFLTQPSGWTSPKRVNPGYIRRERSGGKADRICFHPHRHQHLHRYCQATSDVGACHSHDRCPDFDRLLAL